MLALVAATFAIPEQRTDSDERNALIDFASATAPWKFGQWPIDLASRTLKTDPCSTPASWYGIKCNDGGRIVMISVEGVATGGSIPNSIGDLRHLQHLDVGSNKLSGSLPESLGRLLGLRHLEADGNSFTGMIPATYANLRTTDRGPRRNGAATGGARVFLGFNFVEGQGYGFACPYPEFLMKDTSAYTISRPGGSTVATGWGLPTACGYTEEDATPNEEAPARKSVNRDEL